MGDNLVKLNSGSGSSITWINKQGGNVWINKIAGLDDSSALANTYINDGGGRLLAGTKGEWLRAAQEGASAQVHLLDSGSSNAGERIFTVGNADLINDANMMYGDSTKVSLRSDRFGVYNQDIDLSSNVGGLEFAEAVVNVSSTQAEPATPTCHLFLINCAPSLASELIDLPPKYVEPNTSKVCVATTVAPL